MKYLAAQLNCWSGSLCKEAVVMSVLSSGFAGPLCWFLHLLLLEWIHCTSAFSVVIVSFRPLEDVNFFPFVIHIHEPQYKPGGIVKHCGSSNMARFYNTHIIINSIYVCTAEKLISLLPEYVVPYAIHLLVHDPDYVKVQDIEQLKDIKEWVDTNSFGFSLLFNWRVFIFSLGCHFKLWKCQMRNLDKKFVTNMLSFKCS